MKTEQKENLFYKERKGQSAIEYLMTYGWMLLVVAIVGGAIFATVQGQCTSSSSGFGDNVEVDDFGIGDDNFQVEVRNLGTDPVYISEAELDHDGNSVVTDPDNWDDGEDGDQLRIDVTDTEVITIEDDSVTDSSGCNDLDFSIDYDIGSLTGQGESGTLTDEHEIV